jgi:hypothetical protein
MAKSRYQAHALELFRFGDPGAADPLKLLRGSVLHDDDPLSPVADGE